MRPKPLPPLDVLCRRLNYDPATGILRWRESNGRRAVAGAEAGTMRPTGYRFVEIDHSSHAAHRIAWKLVHGDDPPDRIDHINGDRAGNRLANLRLATPSENSINRAVRRHSGTGVKGVHQRGDNGKWRAYLTAGGKRRWLGQFETMEEAAEAYEKASAELHGEFSRPDRKS